MRGSRPLLAAILLASAAGAGRTPAQTAAPAPEDDERRMLTAMVEAFRHKVPEGFSLSAQINIQPELESGFVDAKAPPLETWHVAVEPGKKVSLNAGPREGTEIIFFTTRRALDLVSEGKMNAMTSILASSSKDPVFTRWERPPGVQSTPELRAKVREFHLQFFNPSLPQRSVLDAAHARVVHGSPAVGLYYYPGLRSAWYEVRKGKRLNEPGDTNPFHQAFTFISGEGMAKIGEKTVKVRAGESYYIPPDSDHVVWTESSEPLRLIWMAWGEGA